MSDQAVLLPKWSSDWRINSAKYQLGYSYTFWTMLILIFSSVQKVMRHPLVQKVYEWPGCCFAKMILQWGDNFFKRRAWSLISILFELWPIMIFSPVPNFGHHPLSSFKKAAFLFKGPGHKTKVTEQAVYLIRALKLENSSIKVVWVNLVFYWP